MDEQEIRLLQVEGQIHALSQAWLYLAASMEMKGVLDPGALERSMLDVNWQGAAFEPHAHKTMQHLVAELSGAREQRRQKDQYQLTGLDE